MNEYRPRTAPPSTDSSRKVLARPSPSLSMAATGVSRSATSVVHTTCASPRPNRSAKAAKAGSTSMAGGSSHVHQNICSMALWFIVTGNSLRMPDESCARVSSCACASSSSRRLATASGCALGSASMIEATRTT